MLMLKVILLYKFLNNALVTEYSELLLKARLLFLCDIKLYQRGVNVSHHFKLVERECNMNARAIYELYQRLFIEFHNKMFQKDLVLVRGLCLPRPLSVCHDVIQLILFFARAFRI